MPTIEDMIIKQVQKYPAIFAPRIGAKNENKRIFSKIAKDIRKNKITGETNNCHAVIS